MILVNAPQGSEEWKAARVGVITASMFTIARSKVKGLDERQAKYVECRRAGMKEKDALALAGYKQSPTSAIVQRALDGEKVSEPSNAAMDYAFRLAAERLGSAPLDDDFETWAMRRGHDLEPQARAIHEVRAGVVVQPCGLVLSDDGWFGASADGWIGKTKGAEYKCLVAPARLKAVYLDNDVSEFADQVQGGMWLSGRAAWDFCLYHPGLASIGLDLWWREWLMDANHIEALESDLWEFKVLVEGCMAKLRVVKASGDPILPAPRA